MTPLLFLAVALSAAPQQSPGTTASERGFLPIVVATTDKPTDGDRALCAVNSESALQKLAPKGYVFVPFETFRLAYPENTFGLRDARRQAALIASSLEAWKSGKKYILVSSLPDEQQRHIRAMFATSGSPVSRDAASNPNLKLCMTVKTTLHLKLGDKGADFELLEKLPHPSESIEQYNTMMEGLHGKPVIDPADSVADPSDSLTFIYPPDVNDPTRRLAWAGEAQQKFASLCAEAKENIRTPTAALIKSLMADDPGNYGRWPTDRMPRFSDLDGHNQHMAEQFFAMTNRGFRAGGGDSVRSFLTNAQTVGVGMRVWLVAMYPQTNEYGVNVIQCIPIDPSWP